MKSLTLLALILITFSSCDISADDDVQPRVEAVAITEVEMATTFVLGTEEIIKVKYTQPSSCHAYAGFDVKANLNVREIALLNTVEIRSDCTPTTNVLERELRFRVASDGTYTFRFFSGFDSSGTATFIERTATVVP